jgi:hypothetical protein
MLHRKIFGGMMPFTRTIIAVALGIMMSGCDRSYSFRYKLNIAVNSPQGIKRTSSVVEVNFTDVGISEQGTRHQLNGQALYLDLGNGAKPLVALLTKQLDPNAGSDASWSRGAGPSDRLLSRLYFARRQDPLWYFLSEVAKEKGPRRISPNDLPDIVTFADVDDPKSVLEVDPEHLEDALGAGVSWGELSLEMTDEPITTGIEHQLPWLNKYVQQNFRLNGSTVGNGKDLPNILSWFDFVRFASMRRMH